MEIRSRFEQLFLAVVLFTTLFALVVQLPSAHGDDFNVLMIGNSYVQGNSTARDVSLDLQGLFNANPVHTGSVTKRAVGGWSLKTHADSSTTTDFITDTTMFQWDAIVLQEQSNRPGRAIKFAGSQLANLDLGGPVLIDLIKQHQPQASVVLYNSWSKFPGHVDLVEYFNNDEDEMLSLTNQGYDRVLENPNMWDHTDIASIARVGDAWDQWYDTHGLGNSSTRLHHVDGTHQSELGGYLAAAVIFEQITGASTIGNSYSGAVTGTVGSVSKVSLLQAQATQVTGASIHEIGDFDLDGDIDGADLLTWQRGISPNPLSAIDLGNWALNFGMPSPAESIFASVPEPTCQLITIMAVSCLLACRQRIESSRLVEQSNNSRNYGIL